jgi:hypothetical protein
VQIRPGIENIERSSFGYLKAVRTYEYFKRKAELANTEGGYAQSEASRKKIGSTSTAQRGCCKLLE